MKDTAVMSTKNEEPAIRCGHCGRLVTDEPRVVGDLERVGCGHCGVQLVRRKGERWQTIRG